MEGTIDEFLDSGFAINPGKSILGNLIGVFDQYIAKYILECFNLDALADAMIHDPEKAKEMIFQYEDVTWDSIFANLKCCEFYEYNDSEKITSDTQKYVSLLEYIHETDAEKLVSEYKCGMKQLAGMLFASVWSGFKKGILGYLKQGEKKESVLETVVRVFKNALKESIEKYSDLISDSDVEEANSFVYILNKTQDLYAEKLYDSKLLFTHTFAAVVKAAEILICNPEYLQFGDRIMSAIKYIVSGAGVFIGEMVEKLLSDSGIDKDSEFGITVSTFIPALVNVTISCVLVVEIDKSSVFKALTDQFNKIPTLTGDIGYYKTMAEKFEKCASELGKYDYDKLKKEIEGYTALANNIQKISSSEDLNNYLLRYYRVIGKELPWGNRSFEEYLEDPDGVLVFK